MYIVLETEIVFIVTKYKIGNHCVYNINYHIVFCPKRRKSILIGDIVSDLESIIHQAAQEAKVKVENIQIMPDHVHIFISTSPAIAPHQIVKRIKGKSANILMKKYKIKLPALWSSSYYCGTVGYVSESVVKSYIDNQKGK